MRDALDHSIPKELAHAFQQATTVKRRIQRIADEVRMLGHQSSSQAMARADTLRLQEHFGKMANDMMDLMPYALCEPCLQALKEGDFTCKHCQGTGWVTKAELHRAFDAGLESVWFRGETELVDANLAEVLSCKTIQ